MGVCTCLRLRKATRRITQIYKHHLKTTDITIGQFSILAHLIGVGDIGCQSMAVGALAVQLQVDPTTLKRSLAPLQARELIEMSPDAADRRVRKIAITTAGFATLAAAIPFWRQAQASISDVLGQTDRQALDLAVDRALDRIARADTNDSEL